MRNVTATESSRRFSELLDAVERGESVRISRGNRPIAEIRPVPRRTGRDLRDALTGIEPPDGRFDAGVADAVGMLVEQGDGS